MKIHFIVNIVILIGNYRKLVKFYVNLVKLELELYFLGGGAGRVW